jgi:hypothetical protein
MGRLATPPQLEALYHPGATTTVAKAESGVKALATVVTAYAMEAQGKSTLPQAAEKEPDGGGAT